MLKLYELLAMEYLERARAFDEASQRLNETLARMRELGGIPHLSRREMQVFELLAQFKSVKEIMAELHISCSTAKTYIASIFSKCGVSSTKELMQKFVNPVRPGKP